MRQVLCKPPHTCRLRLAAPARTSYRVTVVTAAVTGHLTDVRALGEPQLAGAR